MYYFVEIACVIAEMWIAHMFLGNFYAKKRRSILQILGVYGIFGAIIAVLSLLPDMSFVRLAVTFVGIWSIALVLFNAKVIQSPLIMMGTASSSHTKS